MICIHHLLLLILLTAGAHQLAAQQVIVNSTGERIIMYPDGSWRPVGPQDSLLVNQFLQKQAAGADDILPDELLNEGEEQNFLIRRGHAIRARITSQEKKVQNEFRIATNAQFKAAELYRNAEANKAVIEEERMEALEIAYKASVAQLRNAKLNQQAIKKLADEANTLAESPLKITLRKLDQLESKFNLYLTHFEPASPSPVAKNKSIRPASKPAEEKTPKVKRRDASPPTSTVPAVPILTDKRALETTPYQRQPYACQPTLDSIDEASRRKHVVLADEIIFTHTDPDLRPFLKDRDLITCTGRIWKIGPYMYLDVEFHISSSHSQSNFGALASGSLLRMKLLDGEFVSLYNLKSDRGRIDAYTGDTVFSGQYAIGKDEQKKLRTSELDKIRVLWGTGYEDYDVFNIDFFFNQLDCLASH